MALLTGRPTALLAMPLPDCDRSHEAPVLQTAAVDVNARGETVVVEIRNGIAPLFPFPRGNSATQISKANFDSVKMKHLG